MDVVRPGLRPSPWCRIYLNLSDLKPIDPERDPSPIECEPISFEVERNDFREADTFRIELDHEDFPFDPRLVRGVTVELLLTNMSGEMDPETFWRNLSREEQAARWLIAGVVDDVENVADNEGRLTILRGRDYTAYFLDAQLTEEVFWKDKTFPEIVEDLVHPKDEQGNSVRVTTEKLTVTSVPKGAFDQLKPETYKAHPESTKQSKRKRRPRETIWEALQELALEAGVIVYVELGEVVMRLPETLNPDRVEPGTGWRWVFGHNLKRYAPTRRLGRQHGIVVQVSSLNPHTGQPTVVHSPKDAKDQVEQEGSAGPLADDQSKVGKVKKKITVTPYLVRGITDKEQLQKIADGIYESLRHHEMELEISTDDLFDFNGRPIWEIRYSDPVEVEISDSWVGSILVDDLDTQRQKLKELGYENDTAVRMLERLEHLNLPFVLDTVKFTYSTEGDQGFSCEMTLRSRKMVTIETTEKIKRELGLEVE